jgi:putative NADH-flavin reductase
VKLLIFGATGGVGRRLIEQGLAQGYRITAFVRNLSVFSVQHHNLSIIEGNLFDREKIRKAVAGQDAVISALGNKTSRALWRKNTAISEGLANIVSAMEESGVSRMVFVTSFGVNEKIFLPEKWFIKTALKNIFADIPRQEMLLRKSALRWTVVRPARLVNGPAIGRYRSGEDLPIGPFSKISRANVADFLLKSVRDPSMIGKVTTISS